MSCSESDKLERAKMSLTTNAVHEPVMPSNLFAPCFRVSVTSSTEKDRQIQSSLGDFEAMKKLIEFDYGVSTPRISSQPPSFPSQAQPQPKPQPQQPSQLTNGIRSNYKYPPQVTSNLGIPNDRYHIQMDRPNEKIPDPKKNAKPFSKPPSHRDQPHSKPRTVPGRMEPPSTPTEDGMDSVIRNILRTMKTPKIEPLTRITATPRTEIEVQQPNKAHVCAPFFNPKLNNSSGECHTFQTRQLTPLAPVAPLAPLAPLNPMPSSSLTTPRSEIHMDERKNQNKNEGENMNGRGEKRKAESEPEAMQPVLKRKKQKQQIKSIMHFGDTMTTKEAQHYVAKIMLSLRERRRIVVILSQSYVDAYHQSLKCVSSEDFENK